MYLSSFHVVFHDCFCFLHFMLLWTITLGSMGEGGMGFGKGKVVCTDRNATLCPSSA